MRNQENASKDKSRDRASKKALDDDSEDASVDPTSDSELKAQDEVQANEGGEDDEEDDNGGVYEVERVVGHKRERGVLSYHLKWKGYPDSDNTWERDKSVFCKDLVEAYWERYLADGGSKADARGKEPKSNGQAIVQPSSKRLAKSSPAASSSKKQNRDEEVSIGSSTKRQKTDSHIPQRKRMSDRAAVGQKRKVDSEQVDKDADAQKGEDSKQADEEEEVRENWKPPKSWTTWDEHVEVVQTVERSIMGMTVHVTWKNGKESELPLEEAHKKCPQKLIAFYEQHLKFTPA
ncbi:hypothetical protein BGX31_009058 [Mortierella sp. GBA43]|nr:hypothetical protein BGX31_009058 [Mortierella sp. GBA43]